MGNYIVIYHYIYLIKLTMIFYNKDHVRLNGTKATHTPHLIDNIRINYYTASQMLTLLPLMQDTAPTLHHCLLPGL